jgi:hypothetical protein
MMRARFAPLLLLAASASAQTTGAISGRIFDAQSKRPVAGASVTASSPALQGEETARSDSGGEFAIGLLPPGRYTLFIQAEGHQAFTQEGVQVGGGREVRLRLSMLPDTMLAAPFTLGAQAPVVPVDTARAEGSVQTEQLELIPYGRDEPSFESPAVSFPGVLPENLAIFGSPAGATRYRVDGVTVNDPATQLQGRRLLQRFVDQVNVETRGLGAESGRGGAGVIEAVTKSGGNDLHGSAFLDWMPIEIPRKNLRYNIDGGAELGGALERNRVWFYGGFAPVLMAPTSGPATTEYQYVGKITWRPAEGQTFVLSAISDDFSVRYLGNVGDRAAQVDAVLGWSHQSDSDSVQGKVTVVQRADLVGRHRIAYGFDGAHESASGAARWAGAGFLQDTWSPIEDWSIEAGLLVDREDDTATEVLPRVGLAWDFSGAGTSRAYAFYGRFFDPSPVGDATVLIENHLELGVDHRLWRDLVGSLGYVHKMFDGAPDGRTSYDAVTASLAKPFSFGSFLRASYTYSSLRGNGEIAEDAPNQIKLDAAYSYEWSAKTTLLAGTAFRAIEGSPWTTTLDVRVGMVRALSAPYVLALNLDVFNLLNRQEGGAPPLAIRFGGRLSF